MPQLETTPGLTGEEELMKIHRAKGNGKNMKKAQAGMSLIETIVALGVLLIVAAGVMGLAVIALSTTENQGHLGARTAEYAQDKMEQLLALDSCDGTGGPGTGTDTTVFPAAGAGGTGLAGCDPATTPPTPLTGGSLSTTAPVAGYVDYLDASGNLLGGAGGAWQYIRVWQISVPAGTTAMKQISVRVQVRAAVGEQVLVPQSTVTALKTWPF